MEPNYQPLENEMPRHNHLRGRGHVHLGLWDQRGHGSDLPNRFVSGLSQQKHRKPVGVHWKNGKTWKKTDFHVFFRALFPPSSRLIQFPDLTNRHRCASGSEIVGYESPKVSNHRWKSPSLVLEVPFFTLGPFQPQTALDFNLLSSYLHFRYTLAGFPRVSRSQISQSSSHRNSANRTNRSAGYLHIHLSNVPGEHVDVDPSIKMWDGTAKNWDFRDLNAKLGFNWSG